MKKAIRLIFIIVLVFLSVCSMAACNQNNSNNKSSGRDDSNDNQTGDDSNSAHIEQGMTVEQICSVLNETDNFTIRVRKKESETCDCIIKHTQNGYSFWTNSSIFTTLIDSEVRCKYKVAYIENNRYYEYAYGKCSIFGDSFDESENLEIVDCTGYECDIFEAKLGIALKDTFLEILNKEYPIYNIEQNGFSATINLEYEGDIYSIYDVNSTIVSLPNKYENYRQMQTTRDVIEYRTIDNNSVEVADVLPIVRSVTIPAQVNGKIVRSIGQKAFHWCKSLIDIVIPSNITKIGEYAFYLCMSLKNVTIENGVNTIGDYAFIDCRSLIGITIPDSITELGACIFSSCESLTKIDFNGTKFMWYAIQKNSDWRKYVGSFTINCSDGIIEENN